MIINNENGLIVMLPVDPSASDSPSSLWRRAASGATHVYQKPVESLLVGYVAGSAYAILAVVNGAQKGYNLVSETCFPTPSIATKKVTVIETPASELQKKIDVCRKKAGIGEVLEPWRKEIISLAQEVPSDINDTTPTPASSRPALEYNHNLAKAATDVELETLSTNFSRFASLTLIPKISFFGVSILGGPSDKVEFSKVLGFIGATQKSEDSEKKLLDLYIDYCATQMSWSPIEKFFRKRLIKVSYWFLSGALPKIIESACKKVLSEIRSSTDGKIETIFEMLIGHFEKFLQSYVKGTDLEGADAQLDNLTELCSTFFQSKGEKLEPSVNSLFNYLDAVKEEYYKENSLRGIEFKRVTLRRLCNDVRSSSKESIEPLLEKIMGEFENLLQEYKPENLKGLCEEISPFLMDAFFPKLTFCEERFKEIPVLSSFGFLWRTIDRLIDMGVRAFLLPALPGILESGASSVEAAVKGQSAINYKLAIPIVGFINDKLESLGEMLKEPQRKTNEPPPEGLRKKLEGVIKLVMGLADPNKLSRDPQIEKPFENGLINGGFQFMKFWEREQEGLLKSVLELTTDLVFPKTEATLSAPEKDKEKFEKLVKTQEKTIEEISSLIIDTEVKNFCVGTPSIQIEYHLFTEHEKIKRYLEEGISDVRGLQSALKTGIEDVTQSNYKGFDLVLGKHWIVWEGFLSLMEEATKPYYPKAATAILSENFYPLCANAKEQMDQISGLQDQWVLAKRHKELKEHFSIIAKLLETPRELGDFSQIQTLLDKIAILIPSKDSHLPKEVLVLKAWIDGLLTVKQKEDELVLPQIKANILKRPSLFTDSVDLKGLTEEGLAEEIRDKIQALSNLQLNLLYRITPEKSTPSFGKFPLAFVTLVTEFKKWSLKQSTGYQALEEKNRIALVTGAQDLQVQHKGLLNTIKPMAPKAPSHYRESAVNVGARALDYVASTLPTWVTPIFSYINPIQRIKQNLVKDLNAVLEGITPLISGGKVIQPGPVVPLGDYPGVAGNAPIVEGTIEQIEKRKEKTNLYTWVQKLTLYETLKYFQKESLVKRQFRL